MQTKLKQRFQKFFSIMLTTLMVLTSLAPTVFAQAKQNPIEVGPYDLTILDSTHDGKEIDYKKEGKPGYNDYLNDPKKFTQPVGKDQKVSKLSLKLAVNLSAKEAIKEGDTKEIEADLGDEFKNATSTAKPIRYGTGDEIGTYVYNKGKFVLTFSGDYIKNNEVKDLTTTLRTDDVTISNTKMGTGTNGEKSTLYGKVVDKTIIAGYEK
ncbi:MULTISPECIES: hypothetical protein, partial [Terrabacteria group]|uniref:hypothetical protein n=1 Tax=Bacillati TaxID=1783272 RepID=UPI001C6E8BB5